MDVRVLIIYTDELETIKVNDDEIEDLSAIQDKPIKDWFSPSNGRDGWEGLITEIRKIVADESARLNFEFVGSQENKHIFEETIAKYGYGQKADGMSSDEIGKRNMEEAKKAEHLGFFKKAFEVYQRTADYPSAFSSEAQYKVGEYYYDCYQGKDNGVDMDAESALQNAVDYLEKAAISGYGKAQYRLYEILSTELRFEGQEKQAIKWLTQLAESGDADALVELGWCYATGDMVELDEAAAVKCYQIAIEKGNKDAYLRLAEHYRCGAGVPKDTEYAFHLLMEAEKREKDVEIEDKIARYYFEGIGVKQDYKKAVEWYTKAAEQDDAYAQCKLADIYRMGIIGDPDYKKAFVWYQKAAEQDDLDAQYMLAEIYRIGALGEPDYEKACEWHTKVAEQDYANSQFVLAEMYRTGLLGEPDYEKACEWYTKAAEQHHETAQYMLAEMYRIGVLG